MPAARHPVPRGRPGEPEILAPYRPVPPAPPRFLSWWTRPTTILLVAAVVFVLLTTTTVLATLAISDGSPGPPAASPSPSPSGTPTSPPARRTELPGTGTPAPGTSPADGPPATGDAGLPATPAPPGIRFQSGTYEEEYPGPDRGFDFDDNDDVYAPSQSTDVAITRFGLTAANGVGLVRHTGPGRPQVQSCTGIAPTAWVLDVPAGELRAGLTLCFYTSAGRYGYLTVLDAWHNNAGLLDGVTFNFLVWEGPND
jgi:hypothetical protein